MVTTEKEKFQTIRGRFSKRGLNSRIRRNLQIRNRIEEVFHRYFQENKFLKVQTPMKVRCPGFEAHIRPWGISGSSDYLHTSPELSMKKLLVSGVERIYQICPVFRNEAVSNLHEPEFTMVEWYRSFETLSSLKKDIEQLFILSAKEIHAQENDFFFKGKKVDLTNPWPSFSVEELFQRWAGVELSSCLDREAMARQCDRLGLRYQKKDQWDDLYFRIWLNRIEPKLPLDRPCFVEDYPPQMAALSKTSRDSQGKLWANRFEVYVGGIELANAFDELCEPEFNQVRYEESMALRKKHYGDSFTETPMDGDFLTALHEGMPPASGVALGFDRFVMLLANAERIQDVMWMPSSWPEFE